MADDSRTTIEVQLHCVYRGCKTEGVLPMYLNPIGHHGSNPPSDWVFYALGFPTLPSLGVCPEHTRFAVKDDAGPPLDVSVTYEKGRGAYFEIAESGERLGRIFFPTNTLAMEFEGKDVSDRLKAAGPRVAAVLEFRPETLTTRQRRPS